MADGVRAAVLVCGCSCLTAAHASAQGATLFNRPSSLSAPAVTDLRTFEGTGTRVVTTVTVGWYIRFQGAHTHSSEIGVSAMPSTSISRRSTTTALLASLLLLPSSEPAFAQTPAPTKVMVGDKVKRHTRRS